MGEKKATGSLGDYMWQRLLDLRRLSMDKRRKLFQEAIFKEDGGLYDPMVKQYRVVGKPRRLKHERSSQPEPAEL